MTQRGEDHHALRGHLVARLAHQVDGLGLAAHRCHPLLQPVAFTLRHKYRPGNCNRGQTGVDSEESRNGARHPPVRP